jgi:hypothetical protein
LSKRVEKFREETPSKRITVPKPETDIVVEQLVTDANDHNKWLPK